MIPPPRSYLVFDFETTGLHPVRNRIIQVGVCKVGDGEVVERCGWLVNQGVESEPEALQKHGISLADTQALGVAPDRSLAKLLKMMRAAPTCVGHNIHRFDVDFLLAEAKRLGMEPPEYDDYLDTAAWYKGRKLGLRKASDERWRQYALRVLSMPVPGLYYSIPRCLEALGIDARPSKLHDASADAFFTHLILQALCRG